MTHFCPGDDGKTREAVIAAVAAIVGGLLSGALQTILNWWNRPELEIGVEDETAPPNVTQASWPDKETGKLQQKVFARISVGNSGRSGALNCRVFLTKIDELISGKAINPRKISESAQVPWAGNDYRGKNLPNGLTAFADLAQFDKSDQGWEFPPLVAQYLLEELRAHRGTYDFTVVATADNAKIKYATISIKYDGNWKTLRIWVKKQ